MGDTKKLYVCTSVSSDSDHLFDGLTDGIGIYRGGEGLKVPSTDTTGYYKLELSSIEYDVKLYSPGFLNLNFILFTEGNPSVQPYPLIRTEYIDSIVDLFGYNMGNSETVQGLEQQWILKNYFVKDIRFLKKTDGKTECHFLCRSLDYKLTVNKRCEAFTRKKLGADIFKALETRTDIDRIPIEYSPGRMFMLGYNSATGLRDGHHVDGDGKTVIGHDAELIQPYLVRYNESLYDFLVRVAHKCGEFLYFDDGNLCIGLPTGTISNIINNVSTATTISPLCTYPEIVKEREDEADSGMLDLQHTSDGYLYRVSSNDDLTVTDLWNSVVKADLLAPVLKCNRFVDGIEDFLLEVGLDLGRTFYKVPSILKTVYQKYLDAEAQFGADVEDNLDNTFFHNIESLEKKAEQERVLMNFGSTIHPYHLGCDINLQDGLYDRYVVVRMYGTVTDSGENHLAEGVPVFQKAIGKAKDSLDKVVVPPMWNISHIRKASAMEAIVKQTDDPLRVNRVRVKYFWQNDDTLSPWIQVIVPFTSGPDGSGGCTMKLAEGEHVVLNYLEGNIDRPYVDGSFYFRYRDDDGKVLPCSPYQGYHDNEERYYLPKHKIRSIVSGNGHSIKFKDVEDTSLVGQAIPILNTFYNVLKSDSFISDREFQNLPFGTIKGGGLTLSDYSELCSVDINADKRAIDIRSNLGSIKTEAFTGITINVPNGDVMIKGKNVRIEAGNNLTLRSGANIRHEKNKNEDSYGFLMGQLLAGTLARHIRTTTGVKLKNALDLSFLRSCLEIILRPVEGTLTLQSNRNTTVTAGDGQVKIPSGFLSNKYKGIRIEKDLSSENVNFNTIPVISAISTAMVAIDGFYDAAARMYSTVCDCADTFIQSFITSEDKFKDDAKARYTLQTGRVREDLMSSVIRDAKMSRKLLSITKMFNIEDKRKYREISEAYESLQTAVKSYDADILHFCLLQRALKNITYGYAVDTLDFPDEYRRPYQKTLSDDDIWLYNPKMEGVLDPVLVSRKKVMKRSAIIQILLQSETVELMWNGEKLINWREPPDGYIAQTVKKVGDIELYITGSDNDYQWKDVASSIRDKKNKETNSSGGLSSFLKSSVKGVATTMGGGYDYSSDTGQWRMVPGIQKLTNINGLSGPRAFSEISTKGNIFFSHTRGSSLTINKAHNDWVESSNGDAEAIASAVRRLKLDN